MFLRPWGGHSTLIRIFHPECDLCEPKGQISHYRSWLGSVSPGSVGEVTSDAANVTINGWDLSMGNES